MSDRTNGYLVMCEVLNADGSPHETNGGLLLMKTTTTFGLDTSRSTSCGTETNLPLGFPRDQTPQGQFYCSVGGKYLWKRHNQGTPGRADAGLNVEGINAEVAVGQWEYQIFAKGARSWRSIWVSRYCREKRREVQALH